MTRYDWHSDLVALYWFIGIIIALTLFFGTPSAVRRYGDWWFRSKAKLVHEIDRLTREVESQRKRGDEYWERYHSWQAEDNRAREMRELREALRLAERDNSGLYLIIAEQRREIERLKEPK